MSAQSKSDELLSIDDVMRITGKSRQTLASWRFYGKGPKFVKLGHSVAYKRTDLDRWIDRHTFAGTAEYAR